MSYACVDALIDMKFVYAEQKHGDYGKIGRYISIRAYNYSNGFYAGRSYEKSEIIFFEMMMKDRTIIEC